MDFVTERVIAHAEIKGGSCDDFSKLYQREFISCRVSGITPLHNPIEIDAYYNHSGGVVILLKTQVTFINAQTYPGPNDEEYRNGTYVPKNHREWEEWVSKEFAQFGFDGKVRGYSSRFLGDGHEF